MKLSVVLAVVIVMSTSIGEAKDIIIKAEDGGDNYFIKSDAETMDKISQFLVRNETFFREVDSKEVFVSLRDDLKDDGKKVYRRGKEEFREVKGKVKDHYKDKKEQLKDIYKDTKIYVKKAVVKLKNGAKVIFYDTPKRWIKEIKDYFDEEGL